MRKKNHLTKKISNLINESSESIGRAHSDWFGYELIPICVTIKSPIEQALYIGLCTMRELSSTPDTSYSNLGYGMEIKEQFRVGKYIIDFKVSYISGYTKCKKEVLVECDSQKWHERTEAERRYEKCRDRYLNKEGYTVFHYTGSEILKNPYLIACEIISYITEEDDVYFSGVNYGIEFEECYNV